MPYIGQIPAAAALTSSDIADSIITEAKMADDAISLTELKAGTDGEIISWDASGNPVAIGAGTSGHFLKSQGAGSQPVFAAASGGKILQVVQATKTDTATVSSSSFADLGFSADITPSASTSKVFVLFSMMLATQSGQRSGIKLVRESTDLLIGDAAGSRNRSTMQRYDNSGAESQSIIVSYLDSPSTTSEITYKIQCMTESANAFYINRTGSDTDNATYFRGASSVILMEVSV